jgi:anti-sigma B factor antagonist
MTDLQRTAESVIVRLPDEIDVANAESVYNQLCSLCAPSFAVVADLTATTFCDSLGVRQILLAHQYARALGAELRLVVPPAGGVRQVLELLGLDQVLLLYPTVEAAQ